MLRLKGNIPFSPGGSSGENGSPNEKEKIPYDPTETYENPMTNPPSTQPSPRLVGFTRSFVPTGVPTISSSPTETPTQMPSTTPSVSPTDELQSIEAKSMQILTLETTPYKEKMDDTMIGIFEDATLQFVKDNIPSFPSSSTIIIDTTTIKRVEVKYQEYVTPSFDSAYDNPLKAPPPPGVFLTPNGPTIPGLRLEMNVFGEVLYATRTLVDTTVATARSSTSNSSSVSTSNTIQNVQEVHAMFDDIAAYGFETNKTGLLSILHEESEFFRNQTITGSVTGEEGNSSFSKNSSLSATLGGVGAIAVVLGGLFFLYWRRHPRYTHFDDEELV